MSVKVMGMVWDLELSKDEKFVLLAYADHADHDGNSIYPAVKTIAKKCGYSERSIQRITRILETKGLLVAQGGQTGGMGVTAKWSIPIKGDKIAPIQRVTPTTQRVTKTTQRVTPTTLKGDTAMSPESSLTNKNQPSKNRPIPADKTPAEILRPMIDVLAEVTGMEKALNYGRIAKEAKLLLKSNYSPEVIKSTYSRGGRWYAADWRGQKGQVPTLGQVRETIGLLHKNGKAGPKDRSAYVSGEYAEYEARRAARENGDD